MSEIEIIKVDALHNDLAAQLVALKRELDAMKAVVAAVRQLWDSRLGHGSEQAVVDAARGVDWVTVGNVLEAAVTPALVNLHEPFKRFVKALAALDKEPTDGD